MWNVLLGRRFWNNNADRRIELSYGRYVSVGDFMNLVSVLFLVIDMFCLTCLNLFVRHICWVFCCLICSHSIWTRIWKIKHYTERSRKWPMAKLTRMRELYWQPLVCVMLCCVLKCITAVLTLWHNIGTRHERLLNNETMVIVDDEHGRP